MHKQEIYLLREKIEKRALTGKEGGRPVRRQKGRRGRRRNQIEKWVQTLGNEETRIHCENITFATTVSAGLRSSHPFLSVWLMSQAQGAVSKGFLHLTYGQGTQPQKCTNALTCQ